MYNIIKKVFSKMAAERKSKRQKKPKFEYTDNLLFIIRHAVLDVEVNPDVYNDDDKTQIHMIANEMANNIYVDKSYVQFKGNKHEDTFMLEEGWKQFCKLAIDTNFNKNWTIQKDRLLFETYQVLIVAYIEEILKKYGYDCEHIQLEVAEGSSFEVEVYFDHVQDWKHYPGKWQTWKWN